ncbi:hypothetical protein IVB55_32860 [Bradyrhizobium sp. CW4]|uniref:hypothetical protein n=1 Tax=Bradyrhizobium sp. CW4 TaxID=2782687 RepID=UPI001FFA01E3|nr:hypothetical protein [Bradyrhizobium sp. CW4]MCK1417648.1 hypothetical protein [Bradyrhizobium sp. CW4]
MMLVIAAASAPRPAVIVTQINVELLFIGRLNGRSIQRRFQRLEASQLAPRYSLPLKED